MVETSEENQVQTMKEVMDSIRENKFNQLAQILTDNPELIDAPCVQIGKTTILMQVASEGGAGMLQTVLGFDPNQQKVDS